jgi:uncharacterized protein YcbX
MPSTIARLDSIYRYPVKGLSPESLAAVSLTAHAPLPGDRLYAIENGPSGFDPASPAYFPKTQFLMLMRNERLAALKTGFDLATHTLTIAANGTEVARGALQQQQGREAIERFFARYCADELKGPPRILSAPGHSFSDVARKVVSIINLASVADLARVIGKPVDPLRFRGNFYVAGWPAWHEFTLIGATLAIGAARLTPVKRVVRCAATNVDPSNGARDLQIPKTLMQAFGHADCGIYADVATGGDVVRGDGIRIV